jgi:two-component system, OmpR family, phosphate regulon response regulator OmpR
MSDGAAHLLIVDDDRRLRELLGRFLTRGGYRVTAAADAAEARAKLKGVDFDLMIVDVMMPGETGVELVADLRRDNAVPVLLLTAMGDAEHRIKGLEAGADDYLAKPFEPRELLLRIGAILRRARAPAAPPPAIAFGAFRFETSQGVLAKGGRMVPLTARETGLLQALAREPGVVLSRRELARRTGVNDSRAIDVQVTRLRRKIEADPKTPRYLRTVWGQGYGLWID